MLDARKEPLEKIQVEDRLRDSVFRAGLHLQLEAVKLFVVKKDPSLTAEA
jgi:hypothetical protein